MLFRTPSVLLLLLSLACFGYAQSDSDCSGGTNVIPNGNFEESYLSGAWRSGFDPKVIHIQNDIVNNGYGALEFDLASASSSNAKIVCGPFFPTRGATYRFSANVRKSAGTSFTINISDPDGTIKTFDMDADTGADEWEHIEHVFTFEKTALVVTFAGQGDSSVYLDDVELVKCEAKTGSTFQKRSSVDSCGVNVLQNPLFESEGSWGSSFQPTECPPLSRSSANNQCAAISPSSSISQTVSVQKNQAYRFTAKYLAPSADVKFTITNGDNVISYGPFSGNSWESFAETLDTGDMAEVTLGAEVVGDGTAMVDALSFVKVSCGQGTLPERIRRDEL
ncbi:hypothetical protein BKA69DRAFT_1105631 [Paraphysoderma sedebokerense]|nr:hypothetical protein BKA69DRAFT_1105631 [Paraphysoderma sedebokerense]